MSAPDSVEELAGRAGKGDLDAAAELVRLFAPTARRVIRSLASTSRDSQDDLVQEVLVAFVRALPRFEGRSSLETFFYGICVRVVRQHRRATARLLRALESLVASTPEPEVAPVFEDRERESERAKTVCRILDRLPAKRREVLVLYEMQGRSAAEIAEILGIPEATVYTRLYHARRAFRRLAERAPELKKGPE